MSSSIRSVDPSKSALSSHALRYSLGLRVLHWLTALSMFIVIPLAWYMTELDRHNPVTEGWFNLHKSIGLTVFLLTLIRVFTRLSSGAPPLPERIPTFERLLARIGHRLLYVILFAMPISGYVNSYGGGHPVNWFWLFRIPAVIPVDHWLGHLGGQIHGLLAWATYVLIAGHVLAVIYHQLIQRVDILSRMTVSARRN
ncbi:cytochrome b [Paraburkholderia sediminicola]|uniref:cytochrome b n=1 Tax=Paraburkholderia sediminicola TaxID=458836 RepID=UPI0038B85785